MDDRNEKRGSPGGGGQERSDFIDHLRTFLIVLVIAVHAAVTYSGIGSWYYVEKTALSKPELLCFALFESFCQAFFMGLLFFLAGYFAPSSYDRKGFRAFLRERLFRLGVPALFYIFAIHPLTVYGMKRAGLAGEPMSLSAYYGQYLVTGRFLRGTGPLWFVVALLFFSIVYALLRLLLPGREEKGVGLPGNGWLAGLALGMGISTFVVRIVQPIGTSWYNMQFCFFSQYIILFAIGIRARRGDWLRKIPTGAGWKWFWGGLALGTVFWLLLFILGGENLEKFTGGWHWQSAGLSFWESFVCVAMCLGWIVIFRERFYEKGRMQSFASRNAFAVYVFHAPILIAISIALRDWREPPLLKFFLVTLIAVPVCFFFCDKVISRVPLLGRVFFEKRN